MNHSRKLFRHMAAAGFLHKPKRTGHRHHNGNNCDRTIAFFSRRGINDISKNRYGRQQHQYQRERIGEGFRKPPNRRFAAAVYQAVFAKCFACGQHRRLGQARSFAVQGLQQSRLLTGSHPAQVLCALVVFDLRGSNRRMVHQHFFHLLYLPTELFFGEGQSIARAYGAAALRTRDAAVPLFSRCAHRPLVFAVFSLTRHRSAPLLPPESIPFTSDLKKNLSKNQRPHFAIHSAKCGR